MKRVLLLLLIAASSLTGTASGLDGRKVIVDANTTGIDIPPIRFHVVPMPDDGYLFVSSYNDMYLTRTDASGQVLWSKKITGWFGNKLMQQVDAGCFSDNSFYAYVIYTPANPSMDMLRFDAQGNLLWVHTFKEPMDSMEDYSDCKYAVAKPQPDGSIVAGFCSNHRVNGGFLGTLYRRQQTAFRLDASGNVVTRFAHASKGTHNGSYLLPNMSAPVESTDDSALLMVNDFTSVGIGITKVNYNGNPEWMKMYTGVQGLRAYSITTSSDAKNYFVSGLMPGIAGAGWIMKINGSGNIIWQHSYKARLDSVKGLSMFGISHLIENSDGTISAFADAGKDTTGAIYTKEVMLTVSATGAPISAYYYSYDSLFWPYLAKTWHNASGQTIFTSSEKNISSFDAYQTILTRANLPVYCKAIPVNLMMATMSLTDSLVTFPSYNFRDTTKTLNESNHTTYISHTSLCGIATDIKETPDENTAMSLYPNPASSSSTVSIKYEGSTPLPARVLLYDLNGRIIKDAVITDGHSASISLQNISPGMYLVETVSSRSEKTMVRKLIVTE